MAKLKQERGWNQGEIELTIDERNALTNLKNKRNTIRVILIFNGDSYEQITSNSNFIDAEKRLRLRALSIAECATEKGMIKSINLNRLNEGILEVILNKDTSFKRKLWEKDQETYKKQYDGLTIEY